MITKTTFSVSGTWKPSTSERSKKLAGPCEISALKLAAGSGAAVVSIYDSANSESDLKWVLDASTTDVDAQVFDSPLKFAKGVYAVCDQGWNFNPVVSIARVGI